MEDFEPNIIGFLCNWCSYAGADLAGTSRMQYPPNIKIIRVMCSGRVNPVFVVNALQQGADGVIIGGCHPGDCHYERGNYLARRRFAILQKFLEYLGIETAMTQSASASVGEALSVKGHPGAGEAKVSGPGFDNMLVKPDASGVWRLPAAMKAGVYRFTLPDRPERVFAVNILDRAESDIPPAESLTLAGAQIAPEDAGPRRSNVELWPYLVLAALVMVCIEWAVYNSKIRL